VLLIKKNNKFFSFGLALGVGFFFWAVIILAQGAGDAEMLPPVMAGFSPALCFALFSYWGLRRARAV
jgi:lipopolysaccharide export LptBFGC system permease protein LptF